MYAGQDAGPPDKWGTQQVLKWIQENDDSRGEIKSRIMGVVRANDLDGHTLRQLAAEKDEIQDLFPALKDRLAFKSMLRKLFKYQEETPLLPTEPSNLSKTSLPGPPGAAGQHAKDQLTTSLHGRNLATTTLSQLPNLSPTPITFHIRDKFSMTSAQAKYQSLVEDVNHRPVEKRPRLFLNANTPPPAPPSAQKMNDQTSRNTVPSIPREMQRAVKIPRSVQNNSSVPVYFHYPTIAGCLQAKSYTTVNTASVTPPTIPSPTIPSDTQPGTLSSNTTLSSPQISSVTSYALANETARNLRPVHLAAADPTPHHQIPQTSPPPSFMTGYRAMRIDYPAPMPRFSDRLEEMLETSTEGMVGTVRKMLVRECSQFYVGITKGQRLSSSDYANIGKTVIEKFPELASKDGGIPWFSFNKSLSQAIRNLRRRLKQTNDGSLWTEAGALLMGGPASKLQVAPLDAAEVSDGDDGVEEVIEDVEDEDGEEEVFVIKDEMLA